MRAQIISSILVLSLGGCSFLFVTPPHRIAAGKEPKCMADQFLPTVDAVLGAGSAVGAAYLGVSVANDACPTPGSGALDGLTSDLCKVGRGEATITAVGLGISALTFAASSIYGYVNTSECQRVRADYERESHALLPPNIGTENNHCRPAMIPGEPGTCDAGLQCLGDLCVTRCQPGATVKDSWVCDATKYDRCDERHVCVVATRR